MTEGLRSSYLEMMRVHVDEGGQLSHRNGLDLLAEVERLRASPPSPPQAAETRQTETVSFKIRANFVGVSSALKWHGQERIPAGLSDQEAKSAVWAAQRPSFTIELPSRKRPPSGGADATAGAPEGSRS